jgi:4a-hydroxytetrahydrobiopterin dehydratase
MATLLDEALVADALGALDGWEGGHERIRRTVQLDDDRIDGLLGNVQEAADALNHHPEVDRSGSSVTFTLWTHSAGGVTELDIALASRIDDFVLHATGQRRPPVTAAAAADEQPGGRSDADVVADAARAATPDRAGEVATSEHEPDRAEPLIGVPSAAGTPRVPLPDTVPNEPQPGIARPEGQGTPPAGQNVEEPSDRGGPGEPG